MKPPERFPPDDPREWLNRVRGNLAKARVPVPGGYLQTVQGQQSAIQDKAALGKDASSRS